MSIKREVVNDGRAREDRGGGDDRLGCHASVKMLEESVEGKQGGRQGDACKVFFFFLLKLSDGADPFQDTFVCLFVLLFIYLFVCLLITNAQPWVVASECVLLQLQSKKIGLQTQAR